MSVIRRDLLEQVLPLVLTWLSRKGQFRLRLVVLLSRGWGAHWSLTSILPLGLRLMRSIEATSCLILRLIMGGSASLLRLRLLSVADGIRNFSVRLHNADRVHAFQVPKSLRLWLIHTNHCWALRRRSVMGSLSLWNEASRRRSTILRRLSSSLLLRQLLVSVSCLIARLLGCVDRKRGAKFFAVVSNYNDASILWRWTPLSTLLLPSLWRIQHVGSSDLLLSSCSSDTLTSSINWDCLVEELLEVIDLSFSHILSLCKSLTLS